MLRAELALVVALHLVAGCGLLMDFDPGADGAGGAPPGVTSSGTAGASTTSSDATAATTGASTTTSGATTSASTGAGGAPGNGWSLVIGEPDGGRGDERLRALAVAPTGRVAIAGECAASTQVGGFPIDVSPGHTATFVAVFEAPGTTVWARKLSEYDADQGERDEVDIAFDEGENLVVSGSFTRAVDIDEATSYPVAPSDGPDVFIARYDPQGSQITSSHLGGSGSQKGGMLAVRPDGWAYLTGSYCGSMTLPGCDGLPTDVTCDEGDDGRRDIWVAALDPSGECHTAASFGRTSSGRFLANDIAVDTLGRVLLGGRFDGTLAFDPLDPIQSGALGLDAFVARLGDDLDGEYAVALHSEGDPSVLFEDGDGSFRFAGSFELPVAGLGPAGSSKDFVAGIVKNDTPSLTSIVEGPGEAAGFLARQPAGTEWSAYGVFNGLASFDGAPLSGQDGLDIFVARLDEEGGPRDDVIETFTRAGDQILVGAGFDAIGHEVLAGHFENAIDVGDASLASSGGFDIFVVVR